MSHENPVIELRQAGRRFDTPAGVFEALRPTDLDIHAGEYVGIVGPSGSGKSTLLNLVAGIDRPTTGKVRIAGQELGGLGESRLAAHRGRQIGIVFQFFQLIPTLSVLENVHLAMDFVGAIPRRSRQARACSLLERVGLEAHVNKPPSSLSGGEQQRAAVARALANDPPILLADEPTGNLDSVNRDSINELFEKLAEEGRTVLVATHDAAQAARYPRLLELADGRLLSDRRQAA